MLKVITTDSLSYIMLNDFNTSVFAVFNPDLHNRNIRNYLPVLTTCLNTASLWSASFLRKIFSNAIPMRLLDNSN